MSKQDPSTSTINTIHHELYRRPGVFQMFLTFLTFNFPTACTFFSTDATRFMFSSSERVCVYAFERSEQLVLFFDEFISFSFSSGAVLALKLWFYIFVDDFIHFFANYFVL